MEEIKNRISEIEQEIQSLYYEGYTDNSPEIKTKQAEVKGLYAKLKPAKENSKPRVDKEQIKIKNEISEIEQEIQMLYHEGYTDNSPEINEKRAEIKELYAKIKPDKENSKPKVDKEQIKIKNEISEIEQEIQMLYYEGYTDNSPEIKEKQAKIKELYAKIKVSKENDQSKLTKEQIEIQNKISGIEQEIQMLYFDGYTDNSPEIKAKQEEIKKLYSKMKNPQKATETKKETVAKPQTNLIPEQSSDTNSNQNPEYDPTKDPNLHPEAVNYYYNEANGNNQSDLATTGESKLEKIVDSIEDFLIGVAESKPVEFIKGIFSKLADSRLGRFFGKVLRGIKGFGQAVINKIQGLRKENENIEPEIDNDYIVDDLEPEIKENIARDVEIMMETDEKEDVEKEDALDKMRKKRNQDAINGKGRPLRDKDGNKVIIDESGKQEIIEEVKIKNSWRVKQEDLNMEPTPVKSNGEISHENDGRDF